MKERRKHSRKKYHENIYFATRDDLYKSSAEDISAGGMRVHAGGAFSSEANLTLFVDGIAPVIAKGKVVWKTDSAMGVAFIRPDSAALHLPAREALSSD